MSSASPAPPGGDPRDAFFDVSGLKKGMGRKVGKASIGVLVISFTKVALLFGGIMITARLIPPAEYGIFALAMPAIAIALSLSNFGLPQAVVQRATITHAEVSTLFWLNTLFSVVMGLIVVACAGLAARIFNQPEVADVYRVIALSIVFSAMLGQYGAIMRRRLKIVEFEKLILAGDIAGLVVAVITALAGWSYWALVAQQIVSQAVPLGLAMWRTGWTPSSLAQARFGQVIDAVAFGGYIAGMGILNRLMTYTGTVVAGAMLGPAATGVYTRAVRLGNLPPLRIMQPLSGTIMPAFSRLQDDPDALRAMFVRMISRANLILLPVAVIVAAGADPLVAILLGPDWSAAGPLMFWLSIMTLRAGANHGLRYALLSHGHSRALFLTALIRFGVVIAAIWTGAGYGLEAMTAAYMLAELFITLPMMMILATWLTPVTFGTIARASLGGIGFAVLLAAMLILLVNPRIADLPALVEMIVLIGLTGLAYGLMILAIPSLRKDVRTTLTHGLDKIRGRRTAAAG